MSYPLVNIDPENHPFLEKTSLPTPMTARVYVNLPEVITIFNGRLEVSFTHRQSQMLSTLTWAACAEALNDGPFEVVFEDGGTSTAE